MICPLCDHGRGDAFFADARRRYFRCGTCALIFADPATHLSPTEEEAQYRLHRNRPDDEGYRRFLSRLMRPLVERIGPSCEGLDFGCGPGPTLSVMLEEAGHAMQVYDPFFAPDASVLTRTYDFVTCTEAIEHFAVPRREWRTLVGLIEPGGWLGFMTKLSMGVERFPAWHYKDDPTHVSFFGRDTFRHLAERDGLRLEFVGDDVILLRLPEPG